MFDYDLTLVAMTATPVGSPESGLICPIWSCTVEVSTGANEALVQQIVRIVAGTLNYAIQYII